MQTRALVASGAVSGLEVTGEILAPVDVAVTCVNTSDCPPGGACIGGECLACATPTAKAIGSRYLEITPNPGPDPVGILITGIDPEVACVSGHVDDNGLLGGAGTIFQPPAAWGNVTARGESLVAGMEYQVQTDCNPAQPGVSLSDPVSVTLWMHGDTNNDLGVTILDIMRGIDGFRSVLHLPVVPCTTDADCATQGPNFRCDTAFSLCLQVRLENVEIRGASTACEPDTVVSILDIVALVDAFRGVPSECLGQCGL